MAKDHSNKKLQNVSFKDQDLSNANFSNSDLRGVDFSGADLTEADLTHVKTGITPLNTILIFIGALIVSLISGYFAMLAGRTVNEMLASKDQKVRLIGIITIVVTILFILYAWRRGTGKAIKNLIIPFALLAAVAGIIVTVSRLGTGYGILEQLIALMFVMIMFIVGTIARATANTLSVILFLIVAVAGGTFGKSIGGGIGAVIMALACAQVSKRAISGAKGFDSLRKIAFYVTKKLGTSFRNARLAKADFSQSNIHNADFSNADISLVNWGDSKKINCITDSGNGLTIIKNEKHDGPKKHRKDEHDIKQQ
jgi:Pentapeptide repeats (8 copies)